MPRPSLEVADIFRDHGPAWRRANAGHVSLGQLKVMSAIESCRTAALGGHVRAARTAPIPPSPTIPAATGIARSAKELPRSNGSRRAKPAVAGAVLSCRVHPPAPIADIAYQNKAAIYDLLFKASAETMTTVAADPSTSAPASASPRFSIPGVRP